MSPLQICVLAAIAAKWLVQLWLELLNGRSVRANAASVPASFRDFIQPEVYSKSVDYTLAKVRLHVLELTYDTAILILVLFTGILPPLFEGFATGVGATPWQMAALLFLIGLGLSLLSLPWDWFSQFRLEARFGFNTSTQKLWWSDRLKGLVLAIVLGYPLLLAVLKLFERAGQHWWIWAWALLMTFQLVIALVAPAIILPLFNKFTPLPEGSLRARLLDLAQRTGFKAASIQVMDGSKRSRHSNAFFTGFGRFRKIVLFDTLLQQLSEPELEAVLAHEIGHYKKKHIPKMLLASSLGALVGFLCLSWLAAEPCFYHTFGFISQNAAAALLLFGLLAGVVSFWVSPAAHWWSRRYEFQADAFARNAVGTPEPLIGALRKLSEKNLSNLTPHPWYRSFYYSHPTLLERERALLRSAAALG